MFFFQTSANYKFLSENNFLLKYDQVLCLFFAITSFFCLLISVPSTFWLESENLRFGLWLECKMSELLLDSQTEIDNEIKNKSYQLDCNFIQKGIFKNKYQFFSFNQFADSFGFAVFFILKNYLHFVFISSKINALVCSLIALVLLIISLVADSWVYSNDVKLSLWNCCTLSQKKSEYSPDCIPIIDCKYLKSDVIEHKKYKKIIKIL